MADEKKGYLVDRNGKYIEVMDVTARGRKITLSEIIGGLGGTPLTYSALTENLTLGQHEDGLLYVFFESNPVGQGIELGNGGASGANSVGISKIEKTSTSGMVDTYTITYTNGNTSTFTVTNGSDYVLTDADKTEIAEQAAGLVDVPDVDGTLKVSGAAADAAKVGAELSGLSTAIADLKASSLSLGIASDGLIYLFVDGYPVGTGIPQGEIADVYGYIDENNHIVLKGVKEGGSYTFAFIKDDESTIYGGAFEYDDKIYYAVESNLTNCTNSNNEKTVVEGGSYSATIAANSGYELTSVAVIMGGTDVSASAVSGGSISITAVTGNVVITAVAEVAEEQQIINQIPLSTDTDGTIYNGVGYKTNTRIRGTGETAEFSGYSATGFIPAKTGDKLYLYGMYAQDSSGNSRIALYDSSKAVVNCQIYPYKSDGKSDWTNEGNDIWSYTIADANVAFARVSTKKAMDGSEIITVNQPIL